MTTLTAQATDLQLLIVEPDDVYRARTGECLSSRTLAEFRRCPALFRQRELGLLPDVEEEENAFEREAHDLVLRTSQLFEMDVDRAAADPRDGDTFVRGMAGASMHRSPNAASRVRDERAHALDKIVLSVRAHPLAAALFADGVASRVVRCSYLGHDCHDRIDWINPEGGRGIVELMTCERLEGIEGDLAAFGHVRRFAFHRALLMTVWGVDLPVHVVAVERREPYRTGVWRIGARALDRATRENEAAMEELSRCRETDLWPTRFESLRVYDRM